MAALDIDPTGSCDPGAGTFDRDRAGRRPGRRGRRRAARRGEDDRAAFEQISGAEGKAAGSAVPVLEVDATVFDPHHRAGVTALMSTFGRRSSRSDSAWRHG
jgi:hypothetical protein